MNFRMLRADEIDCRIAQIKVDDGKPQWVSLLLYKDARCDQNILDETFGMFGWQKEYTRDNRNCIVSVWDSEKGQWIKKEDTGTESNTEKEKGLASDSFKRACFCWGIGRALYTAPFIKVTSDKCNISYKNGRAACYDNFVVTDIDYKDGNICYLTIKNNRTGKECFKWGKKGEATQQKDIAPDNAPDDPIEPVRDAPATVSTMDKLPQEPPKEENPVKRYIANELTFMKELFEIEDSTEMLAKFSKMRRALIDGGVIEDIPSDKQTMEQAKAMIDAIYANFKPNGDAA